MNVETVKLYGGPKHGEEHAIPAGRDELRVETVMTAPDRTRGIRSGHYTRVHTVGGNSSNEFEWAGYTSPFVPQPLG